MRAWLFVCFIICCEMNIDRYIELEQEVKSIIGGAFVKAFNKSSTDFVLLMARGGYHKHLDRPDNDLTPFVLEDRGDLFPYLGVSFISEPAGKACRNSTGNTIFMEDQAETRWKEKLYQSSYY